MEDNFPLAPGGIGSGQAQVLGNQNRSLEILLNADQRRVAMDQQQQMHLFDLIWNEHQKKESAKAERNRQFQNHLLEIATNNTNVLPKDRASLTVEYKKLAEGLAKMQGEGVDVSQSPDALSKISEFKQKSAIAQFKYDHFKKNLDEFNKDKEGYSEQSWHDYAEHMQNAPLDESFDVNKIPSLQKNFDLPAYLQSLEKNIGTKEVWDENSITPIPGTNNGTGAVRVKTLRDIDSWAVAALKHPKAVEAVDAEIGKTMKDNPQIILGLAKNNPKIAEDRNELRKEYLKYTLHPYAVVKDEVQNVAIRNEKETEEKKAYKSHEDGSWSMSGFTWKPVAPEEYGQIKWKEQTVSLKHVYRPETESTGALPKELSIEEGKFKGVRLSPDIIASDETGKLWAKGSALVKEKAPVSLNNLDGTKYELVQKEVTVPVSRSQVGSRFNMNENVMDERFGKEVKATGKPGNRQANTISDIYNISTYATNPSHEKNVKNNYQSLKKQNVSDQDSIDRYIKTVAPESPITAEMILTSAKKFGVEPQAIIAIIQEDSSIGTKGKAVRTNNPGNIGNDDKGNTRKFSNNQEGLDAVAQWLKSHQRSEPNKAETPRERMMRLKGGK